MVSERLQGAEVCVPQQKTLETRLGEMFQSELLRPLKTAQFWTRSSEQEGFHIYNQGDGPLLQDISSFLVFISGQEPLLAD